MTHRETKPTLLGVHEKYNFISPCELFLSLFVTLVIFILAPIITVLETGGDCGFEC